MVILTGIVLDAYINTLFGFGLLSVFSNIFVVLGVIIAQIFIII
ncbi:MAG: hypothetical protein WCJ39_03900 [bacterium]